MKTDIEILILKQKLADLERENFVLKCALDINPETTNFSSINRDVSPEKIKAYLCNRVAIMECKMNNAKYGIDFYTNVEVKDRDTYSLAAFSESVPNNPLVPSIIQHMMEELMYKVAEDYKL